MEDEVVVTPEVQLETANMWKEHVAALEKEGGLGSESLRMVRLLGGNRENIGYGSGQVRPGELGRWDMFFTLQQCGWSTLEATRMAGLSGPQVRKMERDTYLQDRGVNPDDPKDVTEFEQIERMSPAERDAFIQTAEAVLAEGSS